MSDTESYAELGVALGVNTDCRAFAGTFESLRLAEVETVEPDNVHITVMYPDEMRFDVTDGKESCALARVEQELGSLLVGVEIDLAIFGSKSTNVEALGYKRRKLGIFLRDIDRDKLLDIRDDIKSIYNEETGRNTISLRRKYEPHITLGKKKMSKKSSNLSSGRIGVPQNVHVTGFNIHERTWDVTKRSNPSPPKYDRRFNNDSMRKGRRVVA